MSMGQLRVLSVSAAVILVLFALPAGATVIAGGPYGPGGTLNGYRYNTTSLTWDSARVAAANSYFAGVQGHLVTMGSSAENSFVQTNFGGGDRWIGFTDSTATSTIDGFNLATLGTAEFGSTGGAPYPPAGNRGLGWQWVTGEPLTFVQNWGGGEPNDVGGEDAAHLRGDGLWNDHRAGATLGQTDHFLPSIIEYELGAQSLLYALNYHEARSNVGGSITNLAAAEALLALADGDPGLNARRRGYATIINLLGTGGEGHYANNDAFLLGGEDFAVEATGWIFIPSAGNWTFGTNTDDGSRLVIGPFTKADDVLSGPHDHLAVFNFSSAGWYPLRLVFFERGGGDEVELFAAQGSFGSWDSTNFRLVGDTANGGLMVTNVFPEPATLSLLALGGLSILARRRRQR